MGSQETPGLIGNTPMTLADAYKLFGASENTAWEELERARRVLIQRYHPDKVANLGPKLQEVAEEEGKRINVAFGLRNL